MFFYLFKNRLISLIRQKSIFLFSLVVPLLLALVFFFGIHMTQRENSTIRLGIIGKENALTNYFNKAVNEDGTSIFNLQFTDEWEGEELLKTGDIKGLIKAEPNPTLYVLEESNDQVIIHYYLERYQWHNNIDTLIPNNQLTEEILKSNGNKAANRLVNILPDRVKMLFYNLLVLILLMGARLGFNEVKTILQERSPLGLRILNAPRPRSSICLSNLMAAFIIHIIGVVLFLAFITQVLKLDLLIHSAPLIIISFVTSLFGFSIGTFIFVIIRANNKVKSTILNLLLILGSITAGIFDGNIKYFILERIPLFRYMNPFLLVFDMFYGIASSDNVIQINLNFLIMLIITLALAGYSAIFIRRRDYASI